MIALLVLLAIPIWFPLMVLYFSTWNKHDPYLQEFIEKYGEDELRRMSKLIK